MEEHWHGKVDIVREYTGNASEHKKNQKAVE